ncbi:MAG: SusC/RagA family TonB-linked outer membrane protein [Bacteroidales bacterium]
MKKVLFSVFCFLFLSAGVSAQELKVSGLVISSDDKQPLIGVTVMVKGTKKGSVTDIDGKFSISASPDDKLSFSYVGYTPQVVTLKKSQTLVNVVLNPDSKVLNEVVAIGYGTMKKSDLTGSVSSVTAEKLKMTPVSTVDQALQGRTAGVTVNASSGQPGAAAQVRIRGVGTVNNANPIYVVDGVILDDINFLSPNDVVSIEILKDASATAIYGSRGANGVILVTTRKGSDLGSDAKITFESYAGVQNRWKKLSLMNRDQFADFKATYAFPGSMDLRKSDFNKWIESYFTGKKSMYFPKVKSSTFANGFDYSTSETDWQDEVFQKNALIQNYYIGAQGGSKTSQYSMSASQFDQQGTLMGSWYKRLTLRLNTSHQLKKWLKVGQNLTFMNSTSRSANNNNIYVGVLSSALSMAPWDPTHYPAGSISYPYTGNTAGRDLSGQIAASSNFKNVYNPFSMLENADPSDKWQRWVGDAYVEITPIKGLTFRSDVSMDLSNGAYSLYKPPYNISSYDKSTYNFIQKSLSRYQTTIYENILTYNTKIGKKADVTAMVGVTTDEFDYYSISGSGSDYTTPIVPENRYLNNINIDSLTVSDGVGRTRKNSYLGRLHFSYDNKYLATFNFRRDGSSTFPKENLWGNFPSMALGWRISEEPFFEPLKSKFDGLKLRFGWGRIGNEKVPQNSFTYNVNTPGPTFVGYVFGSPQTLVSGAAVLTYPKIGKWETTEQSNVGIDFALKKGVLTGTVDLFVKDTKEMLVTIKAPAFVGNRYDPMANAGEVRNKGLEFTLEHNGSIGDLKYTLAGNCSLIDNKVTALNGGDPIWREGNLLLSDVGYSINTIWGYKYDGVFKTNEEVAAHVNSKGVVIQPDAGAGDARFVDLNDDGVIDNNDKTDLGSPFPWLTYGFTMNANYKGLDLMFFFQGVHGNSIYNALRLRTEGKGDESTLSTTMTDVWTIDNPNGSIPNPYGSTNNFRASSRYVEDGSYLRLKTAQLGYTIPVKLSKKMGIEKCRFYISGSNLFTLTNYSGYDPEIGNGVDYGNYPQSRTILVGTNISF